MGMLKQALHNWHWNAASTYRKKYLTQNNLTENDGKQSNNKMHLNLKRLSPDAKNTLISLMVVLKDLKFLQGCVDKVVKQSFLVFYYLSKQCSVR